MHLEEVLACDGAQRGEVHNDRVQMLREADVVQEVLGGLVVQERVNESHEHRQSLIVPTFELQDMDPVASRVDRLWALAEICRIALRGASGCHG